MPRFSEFLIVWDSKFKHIFRSLMIDSAYSYPTSASSESLSWYNSVLAIVMGYTFKWWVSLRNFMPQENKMYHLHCLIDIDPHPYNPRTCTKENKEHWNIYLWREIYYACGEAATYLGNLTLYSLLYLLFLYLLFILIFSIFYLFIIYYKGKERSLQWWANLPKFTDF